MMMNTYGANYPTYMPQYQQNNVVGRVCDDFNYISASDIPMDGNPAVFVKRDLSEIQLRRWTNDGRIVTNSYLPQISTLGASVDNLPIESKQSEIDAITQRLQGIEDKLDKLIKPNTTKKVSTDGNN